MMGNRSNPLASQEGDWDPKRGNGRVRKGGKQGGLADDMMEAQALWRDLDSEHSVCGNDGTLGK